MIPRYIAIWIRTTFRDISSCTCSECDCVRLSSTVACFLSIIKLATDAQVMTSSKFYTSAFAFLAINGVSSVLVSSCYQLEAKLRYMLLFVTCHHRSHELDYACARWSVEKSLKIRTTLHHVHDLFIHNAIITVQDPGNHNVSESLITKWRFVSP